MFNENNLANNQYFILLNVSRLLHRKITPPPGITVLAL